MHFIHHSPASSTSSVGSLKALLSPFLTATITQTHCYFSTLPFHAFPFISTSASSSASNSDSACISSTLTLQTNTTHTLPLHSATLLRDYSSFMQDQNEDDNNKGRMETSSVWNNNESHFALSSAQNDDSIHNLNNKSFLPEIRKPTYSNFTLQSSRGSSLLSTHTSFVPHSYLFQSFSVKGAQTIHFLHCLRSSNLYCFMRPPL